MRQCERSPRPISAGLTLTSTQPVEDALPPSHALLIPAVFPGLGLCPRFTSPHTVLEQLLVKRLDQLHRKPPPRLWGAGGGGVKRFTKVSRSLDHSASRKDAGDRLPASVCHIPHCHAPASTALSSHTLSARTHDVLSTQAPALGGLGYSDSF